MTRIIQRCFLVLAFTGILLSRAQETTVSDVSDPTPKSSEQTSPSAPESSFTSIGTASSYWPLKKVEDGSSSRPGTEAVRSTTPEVTENDVTETQSQTVGSVSTGKDSVEVTTTISTSFERSHNPLSDEPGKDEKTSYSSLESTTGLSSEHSEGLIKAHLLAVQPNVAEVSSEKLSSSSDKTTDGKSTKGTTDAANNGHSNVKYEMARDVTDATTGVSEVEEASEKGETTRAAAFQSTEMHSSESSLNDSGPSTVPSKEDLISSNVDKNQLPGEMFSTTTSKVQTEESETADPAKSATHKRSLNATHTMLRSTTVASSDLLGSTVLGTSSHTVLTSEAVEIKDAESATVNEEAATKQQTESPMLQNKSTSEPADEAEKNKIVSSTHGSTLEEVTRSPFTLNSLVGNFDTSAGHSTRDEQMMSELTSVSSIRDAHMFSISSAALSSFSEESIHPSESLDTTAQASNTRYDTSTSSSPRRSPELEVDYPAPTHHSEFSASSEAPVTFDPNGMTHNYSQDPDSITFSPEIFHVDEMPTDGYLSRPENNYSVDPSPALFPDVVKFTEGTTLAFEALESKLGEEGGVRSSEREREMVSPAGHGQLPHDEPDKEEMSNRKTVPSTKQPTENPFLTSGPLSSNTAGTPEIIKFIYPLNDESEEMLNDSPHFGQIQSKSTLAPVTEVKKDFISKDLEMNISNDISHTTGASSQNAPKATHELGFSIDYQPEQSEIRPVTVASPLQTSESITLFPDSFGVESQSPPEVTKPGQSDSALPDTTSPIVLPNPAPSVVNQSSEAANVMLESDVARNVSVVANESENSASVNSNSTIAGVAVKTSVSVSLPLSKTSNVSMHPTVDQIEDDASILSNVSGMVLPVPIDLSKDADGHPPPTTLSTEPSVVSTTASGGLKIRKPKLKIGNRDESDTPRTRKPFLAPPQRSSSTAGPPVSIFNKSRNRGASITSSTTSKPFPQFSTIRVHYASRNPGIMPNGELVFSIEPYTTTELTTTETEEPFSDEPFTEQTQGPIIPSEDDVTLIKVAGCIVVDKGLLWNEQMINRHSPQYKEKANYVQMQLDRLFRSSPIASQLWKIQIDGFSGKRKTRSISIDFFLYLIKSENVASTEQLTTVFHDKLINNTFSRFTVDPAKTTFEILNEEPMKPTTEAPEAEQEPVIPQWAIAVIVVGAASLIFIVLFAVVAILGRHHMRRRYSNKLNDEDSDRPSDWENKMAAAYENLAADTIYDAEDLHSDTYKKKCNSTYHGRPSRSQKADSWSSSDWSPPPRRPRPQVHRIVY